MERDTRCQETPHPCPRQPPWQALVPPPPKGQPGTASQVGGHQRTPNILQRFPKHFSPFHKLRGATVLGSPRILSVQNESEGLESSGPSSRFPDVRARSLGGLWEVSAAHLEGLNYWRQFSAQPRIAKGEISHGARQIFRNLASPTPELSPLLQFPRLLLPGHPTSHFKD